MSENKGSLIQTHPARLFLLIFAGIFSYSWGLDSLFLFDDAPNLDALAFIREASFLSGDFWGFVFSGEAGPTGRPVSLLTFALQAASWPESPLAFKTVNLLIHLCSAGLIYFISYCIAGILGQGNNKSGMIALVTALIWTLHPAQTSTVFYTVQRMALLSNFFMLLGLSGYLHLRLKINDDQSYTPLLMMTLVVTLCGLLALFSKENAPSLVFYLLTLEFTVLKNLSTGQLFRVWRIIVLWLPAIVIMILPIIFLNTLQGNFADRLPFTLGERLLTESRLLWQYIGILLLPTTNSIGLFQDITVSSSLFTPLSTLLAILAWLVVLVIGFIKRGKHALLLFALFWFFSGHLIESTVLPLELYFQHRNYLAFFAIVFVLIYGLFSWESSILDRNRKIWFCTLYLALLVMNTVRISMLWASPINLAENWYVAAPDTVRNAEFYAIELTKYGPEGEILAAGVFSRAIESNPDSVRLPMHLMTLACVNPEVQGPNPQTVLQKARNPGPEERNLVFPIQQIVSLSLEENCPAYSTEFIILLLQTLGGSATENDKGTFLFNEARFKMAAGESEEAVTILQSAYAHSEDSGLLFTLAIQLINMERYTEALDSIELATANVQEDNQIRTGTRSSKLETLAQMREDVLDFMEAAQQAEPLIP
jgi:protein O-mannosyl-transferase